MFSKKDYKYPNEDLIFAICLILMIITSIIVIKVTVGLVLISAILGYIYLRYAQSGILKKCTYAGSSSEQYLQLMAGELSRLFSMFCPEVYIMNSSMLNAFVVGSSHPFSIVITSMAVKKLRKKEVKFLIGHEMGHIDAGHVFRLSIISPFGYSIPVIATVFYMWRMRIEYTADRAGLLSTGDLPAAVLALIKITKEDFTIAMEVNVKKLLKDPERIRAKQLEDVVGFIHPHIANRINKLIDYANSNTYQEIRFDITSQSGPVISLPVICPQCGARNRRAFKVCTRCGAKLPGYN